MKKCCAIAERLRDIEKSLNDMGQPNLIVTLNNDTHELVIMVQGQADSISGELLLSSFEGGAKAYMMDQYKDSIQHLRRKYCGDTNDN